MTVSSDVKVLEHRLEVDSFSSNCFLVLLKNKFNGFLLFISGLEVLPSSSQSCILRNRSNLFKWPLIKTLCSESFVHVVTEFKVVEHTILGLIPLSNTFHLVVFHREVEV